MYCAGDLTIDTGQQRVMCGANEISLPKRSFDLLLALVRSAPNVVSLDRLMHEVWPNLVVSPETVSQRVKLLRDALGDDPRGPRYVAGVRGRGYRIVAPVSCVAAADRSGAELPALPVRETPSRPSAIRTRLPRLSSLALATLALILAATLAWRQISRAPSTTSARPNSVTVSALPERAVAVLPFENMSREASDEFVAQGISDGVLHRLAGIRDLTLIARSSSSVFRDKSTDARQIGRTLNARYLVWGSVQREGDRLRVTAQLIDAASGANVWSLRFDRTVGDIFGAEDEIANGVARALEVSLTQHEHPFARFGTDAYLNYLQGGALIATRKTTDAERAVKRFSRAVEIAPTFAAAYVALADAHLHLAHLKGASDHSPSMDAAYAKAQPLLDRALQLDSSLGEAYVLRADIKDYAGDTAGAEADYIVGLTFSPNDGRGYESFAEFLERQGRFDEALAAIDKARLVDPLTPRNHYLKGLMLQARGSKQEAEALYLQTLQIAPDFYPALTRLAQIRAYRDGRYAEAVKLAEQAVAIDPRARWALAQPVDFYLDVQDVDAARSFALQQVESARAALWLPICLFQQQPERAAEILRANPNRWTEWEDVEAYVIRDAALASGRLDRARVELAKLPTRELHGLYATIALAQVNLALGDRREAERLALTVLDWKGPAFPHAVAYPKAVALALLGRREAAIDQLQRAFEYESKSRWWYVFEREPAFDTLRDDPRFAALATRARTNAAAERTLLQQMRERGEVPRRAARVKAKDAPC